MSENLMPVAVSTPAARRQRRQRARRKQGRFVVPLEVNMNKAKQCRKPLPKQGAKRADIYLEWSDSVESV